MNQAFQGRRAMVTGAAGGIGGAVVKALLAAGAKVLALDRDAAALRALPEQEGLFARAFEIADPASVDAAVAKAGDWLGGLDAVVNSVGIDLYQPFETMQLGDFQEVQRVNLEGPVALCQAALPLLKQGKDAAIVNVASGAGLLPIPNRVAYCASKAGLIMATKAMAMDLAAFGIRANCVCPGAVETGLFRQTLGPDLTRSEVVSRYALGRIGTIEEVAAAILFLASPEASFITGSALAVDGGRVYH
ncbi:MAG: SDR family oxidoreductase [Pseudomonadota bacterium]